MHFESPLFLLLLPLIPVFHFLWKKRTKPPVLKFPVPIPTEARSTNPQKFLNIIRYFSLFLLVIALARPQSSLKQQNRNVQGIDIILVMDVSASMNIEDLSERPRIEVAKDTIRNFIRGRHNDRIGFIIFSGEALTLAPPTLDYGLLFQAIHDAKIGVLRDGTAIGDGLAVAVSRLKDSTAKSRVIILLTDGDNNVGQIDPATAGELAAGYGLKVYTIAIGREGRVRLPIRQKGVFGNVVTHYQYFENALNPSLLKKISSETDGKFYRVTDAKALDSVFSEIDHLEKSDTEDKTRVKYEDKFPGPLKWGLIFLVMEQILSLGWWRVMT